MHWRQVDPVHVVGALLLTGAGALERLFAALAGKSAFIRGLPVASGADWAAIFAHTLPGEGDEAMLPRLKGALPLYQAGGEWWFPVGAELAVPAYARHALLQHFAEISGFCPPAIIVPRFDAGPLSRDVDVYPILLSETEFVG